jgi:hypothetical protein
MSLVFSNLSISIAYRVFKKAVDLTRPTPERQDVPLHGAAAARSATRRIMTSPLQTDERFTSRRIRRGTFVNAR